MLYTVIVCLNDIAISPVRGRTPGNQNPYLKMFYFALLQSAATNKQCQLLVVLEGF